MYSFSFLTRKPRKDKIWLFGTVSENYISKILKKSYERKYRKYDDIYTNNNLFSSIITM
jgi:hypothetical protein